MQREMGMSFGNIRAVWVLVLAALLAVTACSSDKTFNPNVDIEDLTAEQIFQKGEYELSRKRYQEGAEFFSEIERLYPYSEWAKRALIMQAYAQHLEPNYEESRAAAQRYMDFYPADEDAAYAAYLLALTYYDQIADVGRDQDVTIKALEALRVVIEQYPNSKYAEPAKQKFNLAFDQLAAKEMEIGRYYLKLKNYSAAINRFRTVVEKFQTTAHTAEALHRLVEAYLSLGLAQEAQTAAAILGHNHRDSSWYKDSYALLTSEGLSPGASGSGWLSRIYRQVLKGQWL